MPSFLGRLLGLSFRSELLIMNLVGLVNSTLDWSPLKWTNELERIWNLSLSQRTLILDTIGEDTIKTVLSWVVITRIIIAHVYTFTYLTNIYPIITWSRPNLLLPWLILSFFKNVVLEVIVIVIGLLLWYDRRFSIFVFLEFILVKLVPLILASYNWYSNSCLFLHLRYMDKMRTLRRSMRSDSNLISSRLCAKIEDSKYRTRSLTTLLSCESYETYDTHDTISRIIDDLNMTPVQKTMRILGLTNEDIREARLRIKKRVANNVLTEISDEELEENDRTDVTLYYTMDSEYEREMSSILTTKDEIVGDDSVSSETVSSFTKNPLTAGEPQNVEETLQQEAEVSIEQRLGGKKREGTDEIDTKKMKQMKFGPPSQVNDTQLTRRKDTSRFCCSRRSKRSVEKCCSPVKLQALFNCDCLSTDYSFAETQECCAANDATLRTSTPRMKPGNEISEISDPNTDEPLNNPQTAVARPYIYSCSVTNVTTDFATSGCTLMETLLKNNLAILKSVKKSDQSAEQNLPDGDKLVEDLGLARRQENEARARVELFSRHRNRKDLTVTENVVVSLGTSRTEEGEGDPEDDAEMELLQAVVTSKSSADDWSTPVQESNLLHRTSSDPEKSALKFSLPEYSFGDTSIPRFYKDSMGVFDGCYEKDFDNNPELQCLLQQMEKKKWNLFAGQTNLETLLATAFAKEEDQINEGLQSWSSDASEKTDRFEAPIPASSKTRLITENFVCQKMLADQERRRYDSQKPSNSAKSSPLRPTRDACTQIHDTLDQTESFGSLTKSKKRQYAKKRKYFMDKTGSISSASSGNVQANKTESSFSFPKDRPRSPTIHLHRNPSKSSNRGTKKQGDLTRSASEKSVCECKMQKLESKYCASTEFRLDRKEVAQRAAARAKIDSFRTVPLSQVARTTEVSSIVFRRKPPVYPKKPKKESPPQPVAKKTSPKAQQELMEPKRSVDRQSLYSSKMSKSRGHVQSLEEQEAREMRALKVYNELTLLKDKKELEARKKASAARNPVNRVAEDSKRYSRSRRANLQRVERTASGNAAALDEDYVDKENMFVDAMTETDSSVASSSRDTKLTVNTAGVRSFNVPSERQDCSKPLSVNKVTEMLLDNFDRLHGSQVKQDTRKSKMPAEVDTRKQYKRYRKPKKLVDEENVSATSSKKLEGMQKGRELERTPGKEDVRGRSATPARSYQLPKVEFRRDPMTPETNDEELLTTIKSTMYQSIGSSLSSSAVDEGDETQAAFEKSPTIEDQIQTLHTEEIKATMDLGTANAPLVSPSSSVDTQEVAEAASRIEGDANQRTGASRSDGSRPPRRQDLRGFARTIDVSCLAHGVVLANVHAQGKSRQRDIVDDRTERLLHNAFSYKSMDSLLDLPPDILNIEDILNDSSLESSVDEFVCRPSNDAVDVLTDELPTMSHQGGSLEQTILATIRDTQDESWLESQPDGTCDLCIITIDNENSAVGPQEGPDESFERADRRRPPGICELEINEVLSSITEILRDINIGGLDLSSIGNLKLKILRSLANDGAAEVQIEAVAVDGAEDIVDEVEDTGQRLKKEEEFFRFIDEDIFTNIQFPIVIQRSYLDSDALAILNVNSRRLGATTGCGSLLGVNLPTLAEKGEEQDDGEKQETQDYGGEEKMDGVGVEEVFRGKFDVEKSYLMEIEESMIATVSELLSRVSSPYFVGADGSGSEYLEEGKLFPDLGQESVSSICDSSVNLVNDTVLSSVADSLKFYLNSSANDPLFARDGLNKGFARGLNKTFEVVKDGRLSEEEIFGLWEAENSVEDEEAEDEVVNTEESFRAEGMKAGRNIKVEDTTTEESIMIEESFIYAGIQLNEFTDEEEETGVPNLTEEEINDTIGEVKEVEVYGALNNETNPEEIKIVDVDPKVSLKVVLVFWFIVCFFYIQYFYHKIFTFTQISKSTSTLRPFEVHTVSTSTSVLLEKAKLVEKIREENVVEETDATYLTEEHFQRILDSSGAHVSSNIIEFETEDDIEEMTRGIEELMLNFDKQISENASLFSKFDEETSAKRSIHGSFTIESQEEEELISLSPPDDEDSQPQFPPQTESHVEDDGLESVDDLEEITQKRASNLDLGERKLSELRRNEEIKTLQFEEVDDSSSSKSLLGNDHQRSRESQLNVAGKVEIDEEGPGTEEVQQSGEKVESDALVARSKEEPNVEDEPASNQETSMPEETVSTERNAEGSRNSAEVTEAISHGPFETGLEEIDSFDSTYTRLSETSKNTASVADLNNSSMEEFSITSSRSNEAT